MTDAKKTPDKKPADKKTKKSGKLGFITMLIILGFATPFFLPSVVLVLFGLIPTYVAFAADSDDQKSGAVAVGAMNLAGLTPFIIDLWSKGQTMDNSLRILMDANSWLIILGAAAIGQLIVFAVPQAIATMTLTHAETRVKALRKNLDMLKESWGPDVASVKPIDQIVAEK